LRPYLNDNETEENKVKPVQEPITGAEYKGTATTPHLALSQFYAAFNSANLDLIAANWDQTNDIAMDNPLGEIKRSWSEIRSVYESIFRSQAGVQVELYDYTIHRLDEVFYAIGRERVAFKSEGKQVTAIIRTTRIYRKVAGAWKQVHHHGSIDDAELLRRYQVAVHGT
jgi:ketosteroid isomerase-like protein